MIEGPTVDYERVESSTATVDGERVVITLATELSSTSISLPAVEMPRLILAISTAAEMANKARTGSPRVPLLPVRTLRMSASPTLDHVQFVVELSGGAELGFQMLRQAAAEFMHDWIETLKSEKSVRSSKPI